MKRPIPLFLLGFMFLSFLTLPRVFADLRNDPSEDQLKIIIKQAIFNYIDPSQFERLEMNKYSGSDRSKAGKYIVTVYLQTKKGKTTKDSMIYVLKEIKKTGSAILAVGRHNISDIVYCIDGKIKDPYGNVNRGLWFQVDVPGTSVYKIKSYDLPLPDFLRLLQIQYATKDAKKIMNEIRLD